MMKQLFFILLIGLIFIGCSSDSEENKEQDELTFEINPSDVKKILSSEKTSTTIPFSVGGKWTVTSNQEWCLLSPESGNKGSVFLSITLTENTSSDERTAIITIKYGKNSRDITIVQKGKVDAYKLIDLGLSVKWADRNIGAFTSQDFGDFGKGCFLDGYRDPTSMEVQELLDRCEWKRITTISTSGNSSFYYQVTGSNGNNIIIPSAGYSYSGEVCDQGKAGYYTYKDHNFPVRIWNFEKFKPRIEGSVVNWDRMRVTTRMVQGVHNPNFWANKEGTVGKAVDLGLSVKWADHNVGANTIEKFGGWYGWGDATGENYSEEVEDYPSLSHISGTEYDIARKRWSGKWRLPKQSEMNELRQKCVWTYIPEMSCYKITGPNRNYIYLPYKGWRMGRYIVGGSCYYWTESSYKEKGKALKLVVKDGRSQSINLEDFAIDNGAGIRPVTE